MENLYARRNFLKNVALATSGVAFLSSTSILQAFNGNEGPYEGYNPFSEEKTDLRLSAFSGNHITIKGKVFNKSGSAVSQAKVEVWHLSPDSDKFRHQAKMNVDKNGEYSFITDFPDRQPGRYPKIYFKISQGNNVTFTELSLTETNAYINHRHYAQNQVLGNAMFPAEEKIGNQRVVTFNTVV